MLMMKQESIVDVCIAHRKELGRKLPKLVCFPTQHWFHIGQNTCWVELTQQVGLVHFTQHIGLFSLFHPANWVVHLTQIQVHIDHHVGLFKPNLSY